MSKVKLEVGMQVSCIVNGLGYIDRFELYSDTYPIVAKFDRGILTYTADGREVNGDANSTLKLLNIPFTEGLEVECDVYGSGVIYHVSQESDTLKKVSVRFNDGIFRYYTIDGRIDAKANQTLYPQFTI